MKIHRDLGKSRDITGGLPRVTELFEARSPSDPATVSEIDGTVHFEKPRRGSRVVVVTAHDRTDRREYTIPFGKHILVQEGDTAGARRVLEKSLAINPRLARTNFFYARALKEDGDYDGAMTHLRTVLEQFPRDRVVRNELGRVLFLQKRYAEAVKEFEQTLSIDPEDLQAHYNLMLCYNGLGDDAKANEHKARYLRFKADESAQAITGPYRQTHPEDNNERQAIHEHVSVALTAAPTKKAMAGRAAAPSISPARARLGGSK